MEIRVSKPAILTVILGFFLTLLTYYLIDFQTEKNFKAKFFLDAENYITSFEKELEQNLIVLTAVQSLYHASEVVDRDEFREFAHNFLSLKKGIVSIAWVDRVSDRGRTYLEAEMQGAGYADFFISEWGNKNLIQAKSRPEYTPITYIEPEGRHLNLLGFDTSSNPAEADLLADVRNSGEMLASKLIDFTQPEPKSSHRVVYMPVYDALYEIDDPNWRFDHLEGYVRVVFDVGVILETAISSMSQLGIDLFVLDESQSETMQLVHFYASDKTRVLNSDKSRYQSLDETYYSRSLNFAQRKWVVTAIPTQYYMLLNDDNLPLMGALAVFFIFFFIALFIESLMARTYEIEQQVKRRTLELNHSKEQLENISSFQRAILNSANIGIISLDVNGAIQSFNPAAEEIFGYASSEVIEKKHILDFQDSQEFEVVHGVQKELEGSAILAFSAIVDILKQSGKMSRVWKCIRQNGEHFPVELTMTPLRNDLGKTVGYLAIVADVTQRKNFERKQQHLMKDLQQANNELRDFAYVVSHDLKAPLRGIASLASWIVEDYYDKLDDEGRKHLEILLKRVKRMGDLIDGILQYSRIGRMKQEVEWISLEDILSEAIEMLAPPSHIKISYGENLPMIKFDRVQLQQVFQNLLGNAVKYMDKSEGNIRVLTEETENSFLINVQDNGPGIDEKYYEKIFQIFQTLEARDKRESTGVGLAIVKKIVEQARGSIDLTSKIGEGSTFQIQLPKRLINYSKEVTHS